LRRIATQHRDHVLGDRLFDSAAVDDAHACRQSGAVYAFSSRIRAHNRFEYRTQLRDVLAQRIRE